MYCLPGYVPLSDVERRVSDIVVPDGQLIPELAARIPAEAKSDYSVQSRISRYLVASAMEGLVGFSLPTYATSPNGVCLRISHTFLDSMQGIGLTEENQTELFFSSLEPSFIFVNPNHYYLSTAKWDNIDQETWKTHIGERGFQDWCVTAQQVVNFEGWGVSIREADIPKSLGDLVDHLPPIDDPQTIASQCTPSVILATRRENPLMTKSEMRTQFPGVSVRRFNYSWSRAAEEDTSLSKPGRRPKSQVESEH